MYPSGQVQTGSCLVTLQFAFGAQGLSSAQGLTHALFRHAAKSGQSSFREQPTNTGWIWSGGTSKEKHKYMMQQIHIHIHNTLTSVANISPVSCVSRQASTFDVMNCSFTSCKWGTFENETCIQARSCMTNLALSTIFIPTTFVFSFSCKIPTTYYRMHSKIK